MKVEHHLGWSMIESGFECSDGARLFYRAWQPKMPCSHGVRRALVFLHRGHEHSGRIGALVEQLGFREDWAFAWDARGHGYSPGERGDAPSFAQLVDDFDTFIRHISKVYEIDVEQIVLVANSVGAVIAATWLHDYGPRVRGVIMAAAAFDIKLYVPLARPALRLALRFKPSLSVSSYIRSSMLTHSPEQAAAYDGDPLISGTISARVLLELSDTARRIVADAAAIDTPVLMLVADRDYVVEEAPQRRFYASLSSPLKRYIRLDDCFHAIFYESDTELALKESRRFIDTCFTNSPLPPMHYLGADSASASARRYAALQRNETGKALTRAWFGVQRALLSGIGPLSDGIRIGLSHGFDSGAALDYIYENRAGGRAMIGKAIDRRYLQAIGWRGIRLRRVQLQQVLGSLIAAADSARPLRILDVAAGGGRYVLETVKRFQQREIDVTLCDYAQHNLDQARRLAEHLQLRTPVDYQLRDAFSADSYLPREGQYDIVIVSGLYELVSDNAQVMTSLCGIVRVLRPHGHLIYTGQPWHPQLEMIASTLENHRGVPWQMRPRPQVEIDALVALAGCRKISTRIGLDGIFTVSLARKGAAPGAGD
ncbi:MAG: bifunctional alpha/beta hydrolase/class I SAM-dependent methyltransferase [Pseudomonadota bacterium]